MTAATRFLGRDRETLRIRQAWDEARSGKSQVVALVAESGFGKTRLVQEFFAWLSRTHDSDSYWPTLLTGEGGELSVNPEISQRSAAEPEFLWWGLQIRQPLPGKPQLGAAVRDGQEILALLLENYSRQAEIQRLKRRRDALLTDTTVGVATDLADRALTFGVLGLVKTAAETMKAAQNLEERITALQDDGMKPEGMRADIVEVLLQDLRTVCRTPPQGMTPLPLVIVIDDAQWLDHDPATQAFVQMLAAEAAAGEWPLLVLLTCWEKEWRAPNGIGQLFSSAEIDLVVLELDRLDELAELAVAALPGLTPPQIEALTARADGNPGILKELIQAISLPRHFVNRDMEGSLTASGEALITEIGLAQLIQARMNDMPQAVKGVVAAASLQGLKFSPAVAALTADRLGFLDSRTALRTAEDPHALIRLSRKTGEFRLRPYWETAQSMLADLVDVDEAAKALADALHRAEESVESDAVDLSEVWASQTGARDPAIRLAALNGLAHKVAQARVVGDSRTAAKLARQWVQDMTLPPDVDGVDVSSVVMALDDQASRHRLSEWLNAHIEIFQARLDEAERSGDHRNAAYLAGALSNALSDWAVNARYCEAPQSDLVQAAERSVALARARLNRSPTPGSMNNLRVTLQRLSDLTEIPDDRLRLLREQLDLLTQGADGGRAPLVLAQTNTLNRIRDTFREMGDYRGAVEADITTVRAWCAAAESGSHLPITPNLINALAQGVYDLTRAGERDTLNVFYMDAAQILAHRYLQSPCLESLGAIYDYLFRAPAQVAPETRLVALYEHLVSQIKAVSPRTENLAVEDRLSGTWAPRSLS